ncbi:MAG: hypothetical protein F6K41_33525, partial [Symploca sp. SIO3E6]|nr:hypothetical protein [Caldora sp. SIO3E6]
PKVVREFLKLVAPFGVVSQAMQPAFGMAEVCTCMTYQNHIKKFSPPCMKISLSASPRPRVSASLSSQEAGE